MAKSRQSRGNSRPTTNRCAFEPAYYSAWLKLAQCLFFIALFLALLSLALLSTTSPAHASQALLSGTWSGSYNCGRSENTFTLKVEEEAHGMASGVFEFAVPRREAGSYQVQGIISDTNRQFHLTPGDWIVQPSGYAPVSLSGRIDDNGLSIKGEFPECATLEGGGQFHATRSPDSTDGETIEAARSPDRSPSESVEAVAAIELPPISGVYVGYYICEQGYTTLTLSILADAEGALTGTFEFQPPGRSRETSYSLKGQYTADSGRFQLDPDRWLGFAPLGYQMVGVSGRYDAATNTLDASIPATGCSTVEVARNNTLSAQLLREAEETQQQLQNLPPAAIAAGQFPEACLAFRRWSSRVADEYPEANLDQTRLGQVYPRIMNLFEDEYFTQFFGRPYDQLSDAQRSRIGTRTIRQCFQSPHLRGMALWKRQLSRPFTLAAGSFSHAQVMGGVIERRQLRKELSDTIEAVDALPSEAASWPRVAEHEQRSEKYAILWPSEVRPLSEALQAAKQRTATPALEARLQAQLQSAQGFTGIQALDQFPDNNADLIALLEPADRSAYRERLDTARDQLLDGLLSDERAKLEALPTGLEGLQQGARWYREFHSRFNPLMDQEGPRRLRQAFLAQRSELLAASQPELQRRLEAAETPSAASALLDRYVPLASDRQVSKVAALYRLADERREAQQRAAILGREAAGVSRRAPNPAGRAPSEEEMYEAIKALLDNYNANMRGTEAACRAGNFQNDPYLAMQCLAMLGATGGQGGIRAELTRFRKIACAEAQGRPGWVCEYQLSFATSGLELPPSMEGLMQRGDIGQKRFVWDGNRWLALD